MVVEGGGPLGLCVAIAFGEVMQRLANDFGQAIRREGRGGGSRAKRLVAHRFKLGVWRGNRSEGYRSGLTELGEIGSGPMRSASAPSSEPEAPMLVQILRPYFRPKLRTTPLRTSGRPSAPPCSTSYSGADPLDAPNQCPRTRLKCTPRK